MCARNSPVTHPIPSLLDCVSAGTTSCSPDRRLAPTAILFLRTSFSFRAHTHAHTHAHPHTETHPHMHAHTRTYTHADTHSHVPTRTYFTHAETLHINRFAEDKPEPYFTRGLVCNTDDSQCLNCPGFCFRDLITGAPVCAKCPDAYGRVMAQPNRCVCCVSWYTYCCMNVLCVLAAW